MTGTIMRNWTAYRLRHLRPGERATYYRGDFDVDIASNERHGAPRYAAVLRDTRDTALRLEGQGRITLSSCSTTIKGTVQKLIRKLRDEADTSDGPITETVPYECTLIEYTAIGTNNLAAPAHATAELDPSRVRESTNHARTPQDPHSPRSRCPAEG
jgi:hypothetical protein